MPNNQELRLQQTQMLSNQYFRSARAIPSPKQEHHNNTSARSLPSRAQNRGFCAFLGFETLVFRLFEHKIGVFVRFCPPKPSFSGLSSTKSGFLCAFASKYFPIMVFMGSLPAASSRWLSASAPPVSSPQRPGQQHFPDGALPRLRLSQGAPPRRPGQQQTSSGGEKYSGLASNLAHLGRIC